MSLIVCTIVGIEAVRHFSATPPHGTIQALAALPVRQQTPFPRLLPDANGQVVSIPSKPRRIVSHTLATDEILLALCPPERITALTTLADDPAYSNVVAQARTIPARTAAGVEAMIRLQPDLVFVASYTLAETVQLLQATGTPVVRFHQFERLEDIKNNIRLVGYSIGEDESAERLVRHMEDEIAALQARLPRSLVPPRVLFLGEEGYTAGASTTVDDLLKTVGAINVAAEQGLRGHVKLSREQLLRWLPEVIVAGADAATRTAIRQQLLADPAIAATPAGQQGRVVVLEHRHYLTLTHHIAAGMTQLAEQLYNLPRVQERL